MGEKQPALGPPSCGPDVGSSVHFYHRRLSIWVLMSVCCNQMEVNEVYSPGYSILTPCAAPIMLRANLVADVLLPRYDCPSLRLHMYCNGSSILYWKVGTTQDITHRVLSTLGLLVFKAGRCSRCFGGWTGAL